MTDNTVRAGIYSRISRDAAGTGLGVARQQKACHRLATSLGWDVTDVYADNSISAYDRRKKRPEYERLLTDVASGRIEAVLCYAVDRLTRHPIELERLVEVLAAHHTTVRTVVGGELDLNTEEGLLRARIMGSVARFESGRKGERLRDKAAEMIAAGKRPCGGPRPFGYDRHYNDPDDPNRKILSETINEREAAAIRDAAQRLLAGESMRSISAGWNGQGLLTSMGNRWSITSFQQMITSPRLAGMVVHRRKAVQGVVAQWPPILDKDTHERLHALLTGRGTPREGNARKFWLTGSVFCSCGTPMLVGVAYGGKRRYSCKPKVEGGCGGRVIRLEELEAFMKELVIRRLRDPRTLRGLAARQDDSRSEAKRLTLAIDTDERRLPLLKDQLSDGDPADIPEIRGAIRKVRARVAANRDDLARIIGADPLVGLDMDDLEERWETLDVARRAALLRVAGYARVVINPTALRGRFDQDRIELVPL